MKSKRAIKRKAVQLHNANYHASNIAKEQERRIGEGIKKIVEEHKGGK